MQYTVDPSRLLSIVIPTRNRAQYALATIESILRVPGEAFGLIVQTIAIRGGIGIAFKKKFFRPPTPVPVPSYPHVHG